MDSELRDLVRAWAASPDADSVLAKQLDAVAKRTGTFTTKTAQSIRLLGNTLLGGIIQPAEHRQEIAEWCKNVKPGDSSQVTEYSPAGFEFDAAHHVAAMFALYC